MNFIELFIIKILYQPLAKKEVQSQCKETKCVSNIYFPNLYNPTLKDAFLVDIN